MSLSEPNFDARLRDLKQAGAYLGVSPWTVRDYVLAGVLPAIRLPAVRLTRGRRPSGSYRRDLVAPGDERVRGKALGKILLDVRDLDAFIEQHRERRG